MSDDTKDLLLGRSDSVGTFTLASDGVATTTTVTDRRVSANSHISFTASTGGTQSDVTRIVAAKGSFTVTHSAGGAGRTYTYSIHTPRSR